MPATYFRRAASRAHTWAGKGVLVPSVICAVAALIVVIVPGNRPDAWATAERLEFRTSLKEFIRTADDPGHDERLDWTTDKCSAPVLGSAGRTYDFTDPCRRHDFAYRNLARMHGGTRWTAALRKRVDDRFLADMHAHCASRPAVQRTACRAWAKLYYDTVRQFAGP